MPPLHRAPAATFGSAAAVAPSATFSTAPTAGGGAGISALTAASIAEHPFADFSAPAGPVSEGALSCVVVGASMGGFISGAGPVPLPNGGGGDIAGTGLAETGGTDVAGAATATAAGAAPEPLPLALGSAGGGAEAVWGGGGGDIAGTKPAAAGSAATAGARGTAAFSAAAALAAAAAAELSPRGGITTPALDGTAARALEIPIPAFDGTWLTAAAAAAGWTGTPAFDMAAAAEITPARMVAWSPPAFCRADMKSTGGGGDCAIDFDWAGSMREALEVAALFATMDGTALDTAASLDCAAAVTGGTAHGSIGIPDLALPSLGAGTPTKLTGDAIQALVPRTDGRRAEA